MPQASFTLSVPTYLILHLTCQWTVAQEPEAAKPAEEEKKVEETNGKPDGKAEAPKEAPKGIPALGPRKKKAAAAEAAKQAEA